jgi:hypothetical protein
VQPFWIASLWIFCLVAKSVQDGKDRAFQAEDLVAFCGRCAASGADPAAGASCARVVVVLHADASFG